MSRARLFSLALLAAAAITACGAPTAPAAAPPDGPTLDAGTATDSTTESRSGFQTGHG